MTDSIKLVPQIWLNTRDLAVTIQGDCVCSGGACPDVGTAVPSALAKRCLRAVRSGRVEHVYLNQDAFSTQVGANRVFLGAHGPGVVVLGAEDGWICDISPITLDELRARCVTGPSHTVDQAVAALLACGVWRSPQVPGLDKVSNRSDTLTAWLHLTRWCNAECAYCYAERGEQEMSPVMAERAVDAVFRSAVRHGYRRVKLKYAGGEPTLNFDALRAAQRRALARQQESEGLALETVLLTNGIHFPEHQIDYCLRKDIRVSVSLDGVGAHQDAQRPLRGANGSSFDRVAGTLDRLQERGLAPFVSVTITRQSIGGLPPLVEYLLDRGLAFAFNFYREPGASSSDDLSLLPAEMIEGLARAYDVIERRLPTHSLLSLLADRANVSVAHAHTSGAGRDYLTIGPEGDVFKCQMEMAHPVAQIAYQDPLAAVRGDRSGIQNLAVDDKDCGPCVWRYYCAGGCPRLTNLHADRLCKVYHAILPRVVQLEARRLLRYSAPWDWRTSIN